MIYEDVLYPDSFAKNAAAFFSISFSIRSLRFSSLSRLNSSGSADGGRIPEKHPLEPRHTPVSICLAFPG